MKKRTLITSALPYANGYIHLGHVAGAYLPADIYARFLRLSGRDVLYVCGSDEHGVAINISAEKEGTTPEKIIDKYHYSNKEAFEKFGMTFDIYSRTSLRQHHETAREFFAYYLKEGYLVEKEEAQFYDEKAEMFLPDRYVEGECPNCGSDKARGDQCDTCGAYYAQTELKNPVSTVTGNKPTIRKTNHWYMQFDKFQEFLEKYIDEKEGTWKENVIRQTRSWLKQGMQERAITRDLKRGVTLKGIEGVDDERAEGKVLYVWFDAVLGYITATKIWCREHGDNPDKWWKDKETEYIAFIGKDNIVFHTIIFPSLLHGRKDYILPDNVPANEFLNLEGEKLSKSRGHTIEIKDFGAPESKVKPDVMRYALTTGMPETKDADFSWRDYQARNNNELAAILGNFINRTLVFNKKKFDGKVPELKGAYREYLDIWNDTVEKNFSPQNLDTIACDNTRNLLKTMFSELEKITASYRKFRFRDAAGATMNIARAANKYFNDEEPWKTAKTDIDTTAKTLFFCLQIARSLGILIAPIMPATARDIFEMINYEDRYTGEANLPNNDRKNRFIDAARPLLSEGHSLGEPKILFEQVDEEFIAEMLDKLGNKNDAPKKENPGYDEITIEDFAKVKLCTATVLEAEKIKKSKKLIKMQVDLGWEKRQILAGVAQHYKPEDLIGQTIVVVANLKPAKLMGQKSEGMMLCAASEEDGKLIFVSPQGEIDPGEEVR